MTVNEPESVKMCKLAGAPNEDTVQTDLSL